MSEQYTCTAAFHDHTTQHMQTAHAVHGGRIRNLTKQRLNCAPPNLWQLENYELDASIISFFVKIMTLSTFIRKVKDK